jgi:hypothetical protein
MMIILLRPQQIKTIRLKAAGLSLTFSTAARTKRMISADTLSLLITMAFWRLQVARTPIPVHGELVTAAMMTTVQATN